MVPASKWIKVLAPFVVPVIAQAVVLIWWTTWWASGIDVRVKANEGLPQQNLLIIDRLSRVEARVDGVRDQVSDVRDQVSRIANIIDNKHNVNYYEETKNEKEKYDQELF